MERLVQFVGGFGVAFLLFWLMNNLVTISGRDYAIVFILSSIASFFIRIGMHAFSENPKRYRRI